MEKHQKTKINKLLVECIKKRDGYKCLKCGSTQTLHLSHIYPKGKYRMLEFDMDNLKFLCFSDHLHWWHKHPLEAGDWIKKILDKDRLKRLSQKARTNMGLKVVRDYETIKKECEEFLNK